MSARRATAEAAETLAELERFLATAPESLRPWAERELAAERDRAHRPAGRSRDDAPVFDEPEFSAHFDDDDFLDDPTRPRGARRPAVARPAAAAQGASRRSPATFIAPLLALLLVTGIVYGVWASGRPAAPAAANSTAAATATPTLDAARVADLTAKVQANPKDVASLRGLTDEYYAVGQYAKAAEWQTKVVDLQPKDVSSRLVLGAALANAGDAAKAEAQWVTVTQLDPKQAEAWYNLGILHFSADPPQEARAREEWVKVVAIDPNSDLAKNVSTHLNRLGTATTGASGGATTDASGASAPATK